MAQPREIDEEWLRQPEQYEILNFVSAGTYGTVFSGQDRGTGAPVALKFFDYSNCVASEPQYVDQEIQRQAEVADVEGIVTMQGVFWDTPQGLLTGLAAKDDKGRPIVLTKKLNRRSKVIVMELLNGGELFDKVAVKGAFSEAHASVILECVARAFASMHARRRINRDFKLENCVFVHADKDCLDCKIIDLGFVKALPQGSSVILENRHVGTEKFLAPESRMSQGATDMSSVYSTATDVWQLGCFLHVMICFHMPWDVAGNEVAPRMGVADGFKTVRRHCSAHARDLLDQMFQRDPAKRISIAGILAHPFISSRHELSATDLGPHYVEHIKDLKIRKRFRGMLQGCVETGRKQRERVLLLEKSAGITGVTGLNITALHFSQLRQAFLQRTGTASVTASNSTSTVNSVASSASTSSSSSSSTNSGDLHGATLGRAEFAEVLRECGLAGLSHDAVFDVFDEDGSGGVDYFEFVVTLTAFRAPHEVQSLDPQFIFDMLDLNSDQRVTFSEIKAVLGVLMNTQEISDSDLLHLFDVMDNDQGGDVSIQEFRAFLEHNTTINSRGCTLGRAFSGLHPPVCPISAAAAAAAHDPVEDVVNAAIGSARPRSGSSPLASPTKIARKGGK